MGGAGMLMNDLTHSDVAAALSRVCAGETFRNAPQLVNFLSFVIEKALAGQEHAIKGYTIATEALGRPDDFDPQTDPIVRVEAGRLRRALDIYYLGQGKSDPIRIVIPRGTYVPRFEVTPSCAAVPSLEAATEPPIQTASEIEPLAPALSPRAGAGSPGSSVMPAIAAPHRISFSRRAAAALVVASAILVILFALHRNETGWLARAVRAPVTHSNGDANAGLSIVPGRLQVREPVDPSTST
jgi:hypothetical protein